MDTGEKCAIKAISADILSVFHIEKLDMDLRLMSGLRHPGLRVIKDLYEDDDFIFEIMERIDGDTFFDYVRRRENPVSIGEISNIAKQMAEILVYLHSLNPPVILRSFGPENWVLDHDGKIHLIEFASAMRYFPAEKDRDKLYPDEQYRADIGGYTDIFYALGVSGHNAPEVLVGRSEPVSDIYSFGTTLYYLVTGLDLSKPPYRILPLREAHPTLPKDIYDLEFVIGKCTKPDSRERYQNCSEILRDLCACEHMTGLHGRRKWIAKRKMTRKTK